MTEQEKRAWQLLECLTEDTRREVLRENKTITSREQVIASAQRQEELNKHPNAQEKGKSRADQADNHSERPYARKTHANRGRSAGDSGSAHNRWDKSQRGKPSRSGIICYNCDRLGHFASDCRRPKRSDKGKASISSAPPTPSKN